jgi:hypothetical protein
LAYGLALVFALVGLSRLLKQNCDLGMFCAAWLVIFPVLVYLPFNMQRRLSEGIWILFAILFVIAFQSSSKLLRIAGWGIMASGFLTTVILFAGTWFGVINPAQPLYIPREEIEVFQWMEANTHKDAVVLAPFEISNALPAWAPARMVDGLGTESVGHAELHPIIEGFYQGFVPFEKVQSLLRNATVDYIVVPTRVASGGAPENFQQVYSSSTYKIYQADILP